MYETNLPNRAGLTPEFEDGVTAFIEWVKSQHAYMDSEKIKCPCRKCRNEVFKTPNEEYFEAVVAPPLQDEQTPPAPAEESTSTHWGDAMHMNWWADDILPRDNTLPLDYYNTKKLIKDMGLPTEKIDACRNGCMLYWKDDIDLDYCKFCGELDQQMTFHANHQTDEGLNAALIWTLNGLSAYGMAFGWSSAGVMRCPVCMEDTRAFYLQNGRKACYFNCHRQFLPPDHPYGRNKKTFTKNQVERKVARLRLRGEQICNWVEELSPTVEVPLTPGWIRDRA
ncbi:UNVERIFIED_CONTAM: hypothetical protein Slati_4449700 [Sesamum latifolium]|uniref:Transposase-associated domain-containing protein n=1 Tax=Sesamum latifolium TaxID=2727402 RepID=A0AAW2SQH6_9LAMI